MMSATTTLTGARWSEATRCARMAAITLSGAIPEPPGPSLLGLFERGHDVEAAYVRRLAEEYSGPIIQQYPIRWGDEWEMHCDVLLPQADRLHLEVKSTQDLSRVPGCSVEAQGVATTSAVLQAVGQVVADPEGGHAAVVAKSPLDYQEREWPIRITEDLAGLARETMDAVIHAHESGELPPRVCRTPMEARGRQCPHAQTCFADWTPDEPEQLSAELAGLADRLGTAETAYRNASDKQGDAKTQRDELRRELRGYLSPGREYEIGSVLVKVTSVKPRESFSAKDAIATGFLSAEQAARFTTLGQPSERWQVATLNTEDAA